MCCVSVHTVYLHVLKKKKKKFAEIGKQINLISVKKFLNINIKFFIVDMKL